MNTSFAVIIPVYNGGELYKQLLASLPKQTLQPSCVLVMDSGSTDGSLEASEAFGATVVRGTTSEFNHGGTRWRAVKHLPKPVEVVLYLTQDAVPAHDEAFERMIARFDEPRLGGCFGRQLPRMGAAPAEAFARNVNYSDSSYRVDYRGKSARNFRDTLFSNSFSAYRVAALEDINGFPEDVILGEDVLANVAMLEKGWITEYVADAMVRHSHDYTLREEFRRYFDIGVMHRRAQDILGSYGRPTGKGKEYALAEIKHMQPHGLMEAARSVLRSGAKLVAYKLGLMEHKLPLSFKRRISMHHRFWK
ncbi:glycosyltransferase family 2 protein [Frigidibacter sp.]|uniref:glycosyltransferase family 2 protein n=1 Tax=Frigidibacter sp. TaxID=2586418 RepID=UPI002736EB37|nr:glycosyltransferase [Frigidibacter sp.]MDP3342374.1 glycosyltransferase [Frigidibacter sp.]